MAKRLIRLINTAAFLVMGACTKPPQGTVFMILGANGGGTGFQIDMGKGGHVILTNAHVCETAGPSGQMWAVDPSGQAHGTRILYKSPNTDICALTPIKGLTAFSRASRMHDGDSVRALGHPGLRPLTEASGRIIGPGLSVTDMGPMSPEHPCNLPKERIVQGQCVQVINIIKTTVHIMHGSSGSPALNDQGEVVGIYCSISDNGDSNFIPFNTEAE